MLISNHGVPECFSCGPLETPVLSPEEAAAEVATPLGRSRRRDAYHNPNPVKWTEQERLEWETWKEGDPIPDDGAPEEPKLTKPRTSAEWVAWRVAKGLPVSVAIVRELLGLGEEEAEAAMTSDWPSLIQMFEVSRGE